ncbi:unnamed protein product [Blepharisma stoltei]|uniref:EGF-like domain-containing protein n=1 Tax=Blepharisma stoltei TaxID=1481888 RepID=A0AAU9JP50_9CILI|nr:unnamed protein product [Blepharisma stoltei]
MKLAVLLIFLGVASALNCNAYGIAATVDASVYSCNNITVTRANYQILKDITKCETHVTPYNICICPADYQGKTCQGKRQTSCVLSMISPSSGDCDTSGNYNSNLKGFPVCMKVTMDSVASIVIQANCTTKTAGPSIDSYYLSMTDINETQVIKNYTFKYEVNDGKVYSSGPLSASVSTKFIDYNRPTSYNGTLQEIVGASAVLGSQTLLSYNLNRVPKNCLNSGRLYYQVWYDGSLNFVTSTILRSTMDDQNWSPPAWKSKFPTGLVIGLTVGLSAALIIAILIGRYYYIQYKLKKEN